MTRFNKVLVTFIALACLSCSFFPKRELSGTAEERPKIANEVLTGLGTVNANLQTQYTAVSRGMTQSSLKALDNFVVEAASKSAEPQKQADLLKVGFDILVDLRSAKMESLLLQQTIDAMRSAILVFDSKALGLVQQIGRLGLSSGLEAGDALGLENSLVSSASLMGKSLFTLAMVAERAGIVPIEGKFPVLSAEVKARAVAVEDKLAAMPPQLFVYLQPYLSEALTLASKPAAFAETLSAQSAFAFDTTLNGIALINALNTQKKKGLDISNEVINKSLKSWSEVLKQASNTVAQGREPPAPVTIPEIPPTLDAQTGAMPSGFPDWKFVLMEGGEDGTIDLLQNPPVYTPRATFGNSDSYRLRACQQLIPSFCTADKLFTVNRPKPPIVVTLRTSHGNTELFKRGSDLVCEPALHESGHQAIFSWWLQKAGGTELIDITSRSVQTGRMTLSDISTGDRLICKVHSQISNGLRSVSPKDSNWLLVMNSPPQDIQVFMPPLFVGGGERSCDLSESALLSNGSLPADAPSTANRCKLADITVTDIDPADELADFYVTCDGPSPCPFIKDNRVAASKTVSLYLASDLNFEKKSTYDVTLRAVDKGRPDQSYNVAGELIKTIRMNVVNVNDPLMGIFDPSKTFDLSKIYPPYSGASIFWSAVSVPENGPKAVANLDVVDEDCPPDTACQNLNYTFEFENVPAQGASQDSALFDIDANSGALSFKASQVPSYESRTPHVYNLKIKMTDKLAAVSDPAGVKISDFQVNVQDINDPPSDILLTADEIDEESSAGTTVGILSAVDEDGGTTNFTFRGAAAQVGGCYPLNEYFNACGNQIQTRMVFNYEALKLILPFDSVRGKSYFSVNVTAVEQTTQAYSTAKSFKIYLNDVNDVPTDILVSKNVLQELVPETDPLSKIQLSPVDVDSEAGGAQSFTFSVTGVSVNGGPMQVYNPAVHPFEIESGGGASYLKLTRQLTYAGVTFQDNFFEVELSVSNARVGGSVTTFPKSVAIGVSRMTLSNSMFDENAPASSAAPVKIGDLCAETGNTAPACSAWTYALTVPFDGIQISGRELRRTRPFDHETQPNLSIAVTAYKDGVTVQKNIQVSVIDVNDNPGIIVFNPVNPPTDGKLYILEQEAGSTLIGTFATVDADVSDVLDWGFMGVKPDGPAYFTLTPKSGTNGREAELRVGAGTLPAFVPTSREKFVVRVKASDGYGVSATDSENNQYKEITLFIIQNPQLSVLSTPSAGSYFDAQTNTGVPLSVDFRISSSSAVACTPSSDVNTAGVFLSGADSGLVQSWTSVDKASGAGYKDCTLKVTPHTNKTGEVDNVIISARWATSVGMKVSTSTATVKLAFWRPPELNCPSRISLPEGELLSDIPCAVAFSDQSGTGLTPTVSVTSSTCAGLTLSAGLLSLNSFPSSPCNMTVTAGLQGSPVLPLKNKYDSQTFVLSRTIELVPRKFSTNGAVKAIAGDPAGNVYLGGSFTAVDSVPALAITALDFRTNTGTPMTPVWEYAGNRSASCNLTEGFNGVVRVIADAGDGSFWVGGDFTEYRSEQVNYLARLRCSGERVTWHETGSGGFNGPVHAIAVSTDRYVYVGGKFTTFNGAAAKGVIKFDADGVHQTGFASGLPENAIVNSLQLTPDSAALASGQTVWIGGNFSSYSGNSAIKNLVRVDQNADVASGFIGGIFNGEISSLSVVGSSVVAAGVFTSYRSTALQRIAKLDNTGNLDGPFHTVAGGFNDRVEALVNDGTVLFAGGVFTAYRGASASYLAKIKLDDGSLVDSASVPPFASPALNGPVKSLLLMEGGSRLVVGGQFASAGGQTHQRLALVTSGDGSVTTPFNNDFGLNGTVLALASFDAGQKVLVGGEFSAFEGKASSRLAKFSQSGVFDSTFTAGFGTGGFNGDVETLYHSAVQEALYAGGSFTQVGGTAAGRIVKLHVPTDPSNTNQAGSPVAAFSTNAGTGFNDTVRVIKGTLDDSSLYAGGRFYSYAGQSAPALVRLTHAGVLDSGVYGFNFGSGFTSVNAGTPSVNALVVTSGTPHSVYAAGEFDQYKGNQAIRLIKLDSEGVIDPEFDPSVGASGELYALALNGTDLFAGGQFTSYAGNSSAQRLVRLNAQTGAMASGGAYTLNGTVRSLVTGNSGANTHLYAGGGFLSVNSVTTGPLAAVNLATYALNTAFQSAGTRALSLPSSTAVYALHFRTFTDAGGNVIPLLFGGGLFTGYAQRSAPFAIRLNALTGSEAPLP